MIFRVGDIVQEVWDSSSKVMAGKPIGPKLRVKSIHEYGNEQFCRLETIDTRESLPAKRASQLILVKE